MFRRRTSSQKPGDELLANFRQQFPEVAVTSAGEASRPAPPPVRPNPPLVVKGTVKGQEISKVRQIQLIKQHLASPDRPSRDLPAERIVQWLPGTLNGVTVKANPDHGAGCNIISEDFAKSLNLEPGPGTETKIRLPTGQMIHSYGIVKAHFNFEPNQSRSHEISCKVVRNSAYPLLLGSSFLSKMRIFTKFNHLIKKIRMPLSRLSMHLVDDDSGSLVLMPGSMNGIPVLALPDTGSDILALSGDMGRSLGITIDRSSTVSVSFIDGSQKRTDGIVRDVNWRFNADDAPIKCDFHIIEDLQVPVILSNILLDEMDVFSRFADDFVPLKSPDSPKWHDAVFGIRLVERYKKVMLQLEEEYQNDLNSEFPFSRDMVEREVARRIEITARISKLPESLQDAEKHRERSRRWKWDTLRRQHSRASDVASTSHGEQTPGNPASVAPIEALDADADDAPWRRLISRWLGRSGRGDAMVGGGHVDGHVP